MTRLVTLQYYDSDFGHGICYEKHLDDGGIAKLLALMDELAEALEEAEDEQN